MGQSRAKTELTPGQEQVLSNQINLAILLSLLQRQATLADVADAHQLMPMEASVRLRHLTEQGLVTSAYREGPGGSKERVYRAAIDDFELGSLSGGGPGTAADHVQLVLNQLKQDLVYQVLHTDLSLLHLRTVGIRTTPANFERWLERLRELEVEFEAADDQAEGRWYFLTVAAYPQPIRHRK